MNGLIPLFILSVEILVSVIFLHDTIVSSDNRITAGFNFNGCIVRYFKM